uniref:Gustatory receptor 28b n=1 Tax=Cacopsylla melanoneura TaxID=428564 RepID=A0A8D8ZB10_9HEMI
MKLLLRVHNALCRMTYLTTDVFSVQLLLSMACCFGYITSNMYYLSNTLLNKIQDTSEGAGYRKLVFLVFASYWIVVTFLELLFIITACERPVKAAQRTAEICHDIQVKERLPHLHTELQAYSDLLEFQKISLSCCGLFSLDNTLIYSIIGGAATYCVIIIQFGYN